MIKAADKAPASITQNRSYNMKLAQIRDISWALSMFEAGYLRPGSAFAFQCACLTGIVVQVGAFLIDIYTTYSVVGPGSIALSIFLPFLVYQAIGFFRPGPVSYESIIFGVLFAYEPVDKKAYSRLQHQVRAANALDAPALKEWMDIEKQAINHAGKTLPVEAEDFLSKKL